MLTKEDANRCLLQLFNIHHLGLRTWSGSHPRRYCLDCLPPRVHCRHLPHRQNWPQEVTDVRHRPNVCPLRDLHDHGKGWRKSSVVGCIWCNLRDHVRLRLELALNVLSMLPCRWISLTVILEPGFTVQNWCQSDTDTSVVL